MEKIRIGIVGLNFGRHIIQGLRSGSSTEEFAIAAVCDMDREKADLWAAELGVPAYYALEDLLADETIPAIGLFTGPARRAELLKQCMAAGKATMTTKPFENDPKAAYDILLAAQEGGHILHLNSPGPLAPPDIALIEQWRKKYLLGKAVGCRADVWVSYREAADGSWYDDPQRCPVAPVFRLGIYLINDLVRIYGPAKRVNVLFSRLFTGRPTPDNAQLGIEFQDGNLANISASFCVNDGDHYRNGLTLNFENGTVYRNVGPQRGEGASELSLVQEFRGARTITAQATSDGGSGEYQWENFARAIRGEELTDVVTPRQVVEGLLIIEAMARAAEGEGVANVRSIDDL